MFGIFRKKKCFKKSYLAGARLISSSPRGVYDVVIQFNAFYSPYDYCFIWGMGIDAINKMNGIIKLDCRATKVGCNDEPETASCYA